MINWLIIDKLGIISTRGIRSGGSLAPQAISETFPKMWALAASGNLRIDVEQVPLADVEKVWKRGDVDGRRLVFVP
jgi:hypothetical protein